MDGRQTFAEFCKRHRSSYNVKYPFLHSSQIRAKLQTSWKRLTSRDLTTSDRRRSAPATLAPAASDFMSQTEPLTKNKENSTPKLDEDPTSAKDEDWNPEKSLPNWLEFKEKENQKYEKSLRSKRESRKKYYDAVRSSTSDPEPCASTTYKTIPSPTPNKTSEKQPNCIIDTSEYTAKEKIPFEYCEQTNEFQYLFPEDEVPSADTTVTLPSTFSGETSVDDVSTSLPLSENPTDVTTNLNVTVPSFEDICADNDLGLGGEMTTVPAWEGGSVRFESPPIMLGSRFVLHQSFEDICMQHGIESSDVTFADDNLESLEIDSSETTDDSVWDASTHQDGNRLISNESSTQSQSATSSESSEAMEMSSQDRKVKPADEQIPAEKDRMGVVMKTFIDSKTVSPTCAEKSKKMRKRSIHDVIEALHDRRRGRKSAQPLDGASFKISPNRKQPSTTAAYTGGPNGEPADSPYVFLHRLTPSDSVKLKSDTSNASIADCPTNFSDSPSESSCIEVKAKRCASVTTETATENSSLDTNPGANDNEKSSTTESSDHNETVAGCVITEKSSGLTGMRGNKAESQESESANTKIPTENLNLSVDAEIVTKTDTEQSSPIDQVSDHTPTEPREADEPLEVDQSAEPGGGEAVYCIGASPGRTHRLSDGQPSTANHCDTDTQGEEAGSSSNVEQTTTEDASTSLLCEDSDSEDFVMSLRKESVDVVSPVRDSGGRDVLGELFSDKPVKPKES